MTSIDDLPTIEGAGRLGRAHDADSAVAAAYRMNGPRGSTLLDSLGISRAIELAGALSRQHVGPCSERGTPTKLTETIVSMT